MEVQTKFISNTISDNDLNYFSHLKGITESVDEESALIIAKGKTEYSFRLAPSHPMYLVPLITEINKFHNLFKIKVDFSKSMKTSATISFKIKIFE